MEQWSCCIRVMNKLRKCPKLRRDIGYIQVWKTLVIPTTRLIVVGDLTRHTKIWREQGPYWLINQALYRYNFWKEEEVMAILSRSREPTNLDTLWYEYVHITDLDTDTRHISKGLAVFLCFFPSFGFTLGPTAQRPETGDLCFQLLASFFPPNHQQYTHCYCKLSQVCSISCAFCFLLSAFCFLKSQFLVHFAFCFFTCQRGSRRCKGFILSSFFAFWVFQKL